MSHDNRKQDSIPLEVSSEVAYSIEDGPVVVSYRKRGFLRDVHVTDGKQTRHKSPVGLNAKEILEARADSLRADLDAKG